MIYPIPNSCCSVDTQSQKNIDGILKKSSFYCLNNYIKPLCGPQGQSVRRVQRTKSSMPKASPKGCQLEVGARPATTV